MISFMRGQGNRRRTRGGRYPLRTTTSNPSSGWTSREGTGSGARSDRVRFSVFSRGMTAN